MFGKEFPIQPVSDKDLAEQVRRNGIARKMGWGSWGAAATIIGISALPGGMTLPAGIIIGGLVVLGARVNEYVSNRKTVRAAEGNNSYLSEKVMAAHRFRVAKNTEGIVGTVGTIVAIPAAAPAVPVGLAAAAGYVGLRVAEGTQNLAAAHEAREMLGVNNARRERSAKRTSSDPRA